MATDSGTYDQATLLRRAKIAEAMMADPKKPVTHWAEGLNELAKGLFGGYQEAKLDAENKQSKYGDSAALAAQLGLPAPSSPSQSTSGAAKIASLLGFDFPGNSSPSVSPSSAAAASDVPQQAAPVSPAVNPMGNVAAAMSSSPDASLPRGFRNNNPGNIEDGPFAKSQPGYVGSDGRFAKFAAMDNGTGAMGALLNSYGKRGLNTVNGIINRWAPSSDGNNVSAYAANVAKQLGIGPDDPIPPGMQPQLIAAMAQHENGRPLPSGQPPASADQPSPLDTAQYPAGPVGAPPTPGGNPNAVAAAMGNDPAALPANAQATQGFAIPGQPAKPDVAGALSSPPVQGGILANATPQQKAMIAAGLNARPGSAAHTLAMSTVQEVMKQQMQQSDPAHQLDLRLKQLAIRKAQQDASKSDWEWKPYGRDANGNWTYAWVNSKTQAIKGRDGQPIPTTPKPAEDPAEGLMGEDYLKAIPRDRADIARKVANGEVDVSSLPNRGNYRMQVLSDAARFDPTFNPIDYKTRLATRKDFTSGKSAQNITSFNTAIGHLDSLDKSIDNLGNRGSSWYNAATAPIAGQVDQKYQVALKDFNTSKQAVIDELTRAFRGSGGNVYDLQEWEKSINATESPAALHAATRRAIELLRSRIEAVGDQYNRGMGKKTDPISLLSPKAQEAMARLEGIGAQPSDASGQRKTSSGVSWSIQ